jgi:hypothetical protein
MLVDGRLECRSWQALVSVVFDVSVSSAQDDVLLMERETLYDSAGQHLARQFCGEWD